MFFPSGRGSPDFRRRSSACRCASSMPSAILSAHLGFADIRNYALDMREKGVPLVLSEGREVGLVREGSRYVLTIPPRTLVVLN